MRSPRVERQEVLLDVLYRVASYCASDDDDQAGHALRMTRDIYADLLSAGTKRDLEAVSMMRQALSTYGIPVAALELAGGAE